MDSSQIQLIKSGILTKIKPNRKRIQYFVLSKSFEKNEIQHRIDQYDSESKFNSSPSRPKKSFLLGKCLCLYKRTEEKLKNAFTLIGTNDTWTIAAASEQEGNEWIVVLKEFVPTRPEPYNYAWDVTVTKQEYHDKLASAPKLNGNHRLCLTDAAAVLLKTGEEKPTLHIPLTCIRRVGLSKNIILESGQQSEVGSATFRLKLENAQVASTVHRLVIDHCQQCLKKMTERCRGTNSPFPRSDSFDVNANSVSQREFYSDLSFALSSDADQYVPMPAVSERTLHGSPLDATRRRRLSKSDPDGVASEADSYASITPGASQEQSDYVAMAPASHRPLRGSSGTLATSPPGRPAPGWPADHADNERMASRVYSVGACAAPRRREAALDKRLAIPNSSSMPMLLGLQKSPSGTSSPAGESCRSRTDSGGAEMRAAVAQDKCRSSSFGQRTDGPTGKVETGVHPQRPRPAAASARAVGQSALERCRSSSFGQHLKRPSPVDPFPRTSSFSHVVRRSPPPPPASTNTLLTPRVSPSARQPYDKPRRELQPDTYMAMEFAPKAGSGDEMRSRSGSASSFRSPSGSCSSASHRSRSSSTASQVNRAAGASHEKPKDAAAGDPASKLAKSRPTLQLLHVDPCSTRAAGFLSPPSAASQSLHGPLAATPESPPSEPSTPLSSLLSQRFSTSYLFAAIDKTRSTPAESIQEEDSQFQVNSLTSHLAVSAEPDVDLCRRC